MKKIISLSLVLMFSTFVFAQQDDTADKTLNEAYKKANAEHKNVFVIFHASWCGWCKKLDASMNDNSTKKNILMKVM
jgi:thioredoxin-related protein